MRRTVVLTVCLLASSAGGTAPLAQSRKPMTLVDLIGIPRIQDPQLSPDGASISYQLARADWNANRLITHIWRQPVAGGSPTQVTNTETGETNARWSPDA